MKNHPPYVNRECQVCGCKEEVKRCLEFNMDLCYHCFVSSTVEDLKMFNEAYYKKNNDN